MAGPAVQSQATATVDQSAEEIIHRWQEIDKALAEPRRNYWLNLSFFFGQQHVVWNGYDGRATLWNDTETTRLRVTFNEIAPRVRSLLGRMFGKNLTFEVPPDKTDDATRAGARLAEAILEHKRSTQRWETVRAEAGFDMMMGGTAAVSWAWDQTAGRPLFQQDGVTYGEGECRLNHWSVADFGLEPNVRSQDEARYWMSLEMAPPAVVKDHYKLDWDPGPDGRTVHSPAMTKLLADRGSPAGKDLTLVYTLYEKPNRATPQGRYAVVVNSKLVVDQPWPFPPDVNGEHHLNLYVFRETPIPNRWWGATIVSQARSIQVAYNLSWALILETMKRAATTRLWAPMGSMRDDQALTDEPGEIVEYFAEFGQPTYASPPELSRYIAQMPDRLEGLLDEILHTHAITRGESIGDRASGFMVSLLAEKDDTPMGGVAKDQSIGWGVVGSRLLELYQAYATGERQAVVPTKSGVPVTLPWDGRRLHGQVHARVPLTATSPQSRAASMAQLQSARELAPEFFAKLNPDRLMDIIDLPGRAILQEIQDPDVARAQRENDMMAAGEPMLPASYDEHAKHMAEHNEFRKSDLYLLLDDQTRWVFDSHIRAHEAMAREEVLRLFLENQRIPGMGAMPQGDDPLGATLPSPASMMASAGGPPPR